MKLLLLALIAYLTKKGIIVLPFDLKWFSKKIKKMLNKVALINQITLHPVGVWTLLLNIIKPHIRWGRDIHFLTIKKMICNF